MKQKKTEEAELTIATRGPEQLGIALGRFRNQSNLTQAKLARSAGLRQATISKTEKGQGTTELKTIYAICAALGLELVVRPRKNSSTLRAEDVF